MNNYDFIVMQKEVLDKYKNTDSDVNLDSQLVKLPDTIANGTVYKLSYDGNYETDGYEKGFLIIPKGSGIKKHKHVDNIEEYTLVSGTLNINGETVNNNICLLGDEHCIDNVSETTIVRTLKISKFKIYEDEVEKSNKMK